MMVPMSIEQVTETHRGRRDITSCSGHRQAEAGIGRSRSEGLHITTMSRRICITRHATQRVRQRRTLQSQQGSVCLSVTYHPRYHRLPPRIPPADIQYNVDDSIKAQPLREKRPESNHGSKIPPRLPGIHRCLRGKNTDGWCSKIREFFLVYLFIHTATI